MIKELRQMGYRKLDHDLWAKVVGFNMFIFSEERATWTNWFKGANDKNLVWDSKTYGSGDLLFFLKMVESDTKIMGSHNPSEYEFLTVEEGVELEL